MFWNFNFVFYQIFEIKRSFILILIKRLRSGIFEESLEKPRLGNKWDWLKKSGLNSNLLYDIPVSQSLLINVSFQLLNDTSFNYPKKKVRIVKLQSYQRI